MTFLILFGVIFWSTARFMRHQIDDSVSTELNELLTDAQARGSGGLRPLVEGMARHPAGFYYLLQDPQGDVLAGNLPALDPQPGIREWPESTRSGRPGYSAIRGAGVLTSGGYLFVGWSTYQLHEMEEFVARSFLGILAASVVLALVGGVVMSKRLLRQIESVSETSRDIIRGDLHRRVSLQHGGDEFDHLALSINAMLDRIETLMDDLRQVTTDIAHDLRTPLTRLRNRLDFAQRTQADASSLRETLNAARRETELILDVFGALLRIAQVESGARKAAFALLDAREIVDTVLEVYRPAAEERRQTVAERIEGELTVSGDRELLTQLFANLLENAIRHSPDGAHIEVAARSHAGLVAVSIADDGPGIPEAMRAKVLRRFFRLENSRTTPGSGLGLSLASAIATLHEAAMDLSDNAPGLRITVSFAAPPPHPPPATGGDHE